MSFCIVSGEETLNRYKGVLISPSVLSFAQEYRTKLNVQQISKIKPLVTTRSVLKMFVEMKTKHKMSWPDIKDKLNDELLLKGLITDEEYNARIVQ